MTITSNNDSLNTSQSQLPKITIFPYLVMSVVSITIFQDLVIIYVILRAQLKLVRAEFAIVLANTIFCFAFKLIGLFKSIQSAIDMRQLGLVRCFLIYSLDIDLLFANLAVLFYYSLFHLSVVARNSFTRFLFAITHNVYPFLIYLLLVCGGFTVFILAYSIRFSDEMFDVSNHRCERPIILTLIPPMFCLISVPSQLAYTFSIVFLIFNRLATETKILRASVKKTFRKHLVVMIKFFVFSFLICLIAAPIYLTPLLNIFYGASFSDKIRFIFDVIFLVFFSSESLILALIHVKIRSVFKISLVSIKSGFFGNVKLPTRE